ncbi:MAG: sulfurtransferase [Lachnospiraceae bacterium]|nr:sulfurtransferase [Lachnospiraceae bacterium]
MNMSRLFLLFLVAVVMMPFMLSGCATHTYADTPESLIIDASALADLMTQENVVFVDMQAPEEYAKEHLEGAVNIPSAEIVISVPVQNMLTSKAKIEEVMGANGISNDSLVIAYDTDKMSASRLLWSLYMYGFDKIKVVNGGFEAIKAAGLSVTDAVPSVTPATFTAGEALGDYNVKMAYVKDIVDNPREGVTLLDVRSDEEYMAEGKIPTAVMRNYLENYYEDATFKVKEMTRINYKEIGVYPEDEIIIYCRSSFRAAPVFVQLYEAGYRNIKLYDGAFLEWTGNASNPVEMPEGAAAPAKQDAS